MCFCRKEGYKDFGDILSTSYDFSTVGYTIRDYTVCISETCQIDSDGYQRCYCDRSETRKKVIRCVIPLITNGTQKSCMVCGKMQHAKHSNIIARSTQLILW